MVKNLNTIDRGTSISIGALSSAGENSIVLNATGTAFHPTGTDGFFVKPIRTNIGGDGGIVEYNNDGEITKTNTSVKRLESDISGNQSLYFNLNDTVTDGFANLEAQIANLDLQQVTNKGQTTTNPITVDKLNINNIDYDESITSNILAIDPSTKKLIDVGNFSVTGVNNNLQTVLNIGKDTNTNINFTNNVQVTASVIDSRVNIGYLAGNTGAGVRGVAIGTAAGRNGQNAYSVAIGANAGETSQYENSVSIGNSAGRTKQDAFSVAIGSLAGFENQGRNTVAVGDNAGREQQQDLAVAIGSQAGRVGQKTFAISIGIAAGAYDQNTSSIAIGANSGFNSQGLYSVAIGHFAARENQRDKAVAIGADAGRFNQGSSSIAIGANSNALDNSIVLNATGLNLFGTHTSNTYIKPIHSFNINSGGATSNVITVNALNYGLLYCNVQTGQICVVGQ